VECVHHDWMRRFALGCYYCFWTWDERFI